MSSKLIKDQECRAAFDAARADRFGVHRIDVVCEPDIFRAGYAAGMSRQPADQQRTETAADNCEVLRARLARYEDADGRALQRGGEVLSDEELWSIRNQVAIHQVLRDDDSVKICVKHGRAIEQAVLARLNSSPVSSGDPEKCSYQDDPRSPAELSLAGCNCVRFGEGNPHWPCKLHAPVSAGVVDELLRDALNTAINSMLDSGYNRNSVIIQKCRAALSAPSHGEQVRHMVPEGFRVMKPTSSVVRYGERWEIYAPCGSGGIVNEDDVTDWVVRQLLDAMAAPSAGSQKEQG